VRQTDLEMEREPRDAAAGGGDLDDVSHRYRSHSGSAGREWDRWIACQAKVNSTSSVTGWPNVEGDRV
jgi:hypothetical protein